MSQMTSRCNGNHSLSLSLPLAVAFCLFCFCCHNRFNVYTNFSLEVAEWMGRTDWQRYVVPQKGTREVYTCFEFERERVGWGERRGGGGGNWHYVHCTDRSGRTNTNITQYMYTTSHNLKLYSSQIDKLCLNTNTALEIVHEHRKVILPKQTIQKANNFRAQLSKWFTSHSLVTCLKVAKGNKYYLSTLGSAKIYLKIKTKTTENQNKQANNNNSSTSRGSSNNKNQQNNHKHKTNKQRTKST